MNPADPGVRPRSLWRNRDFMLLWSGQAVSVLGSQISSIAFPLLVLATTGSPADAGLVGFAATLPYLLFQLPAGALVDRFDRRVVMLCCDLGRALALASIPVAMLLGELALPQIMAAAFIDGMLLVAFMPAEQAAVANVVPREQLTSAIAQNEARTRGAALAGRPLGGLLFGMAQALPFVADAVSYLVSAMALTLIRGQFQVARPARRERLPGRLAEGLAFLWRQSFLRAAAALVAGSNFVFQAMVLVVIVLAKDRGASAFEVGVILGFGGAGGLIGAFAAPWFSRRLPERAVIIGANWVWAALLPMMLIVPGSLALGPIFGLAAFIGPAWNVVVGTYQLTLTPDRLRGRVGAAELAIAWGAIPLGSLCAGFLLEAVGAFAATAVMCGLMVAIAVAATVSPAVRHAPRLSEVAA